LFATLDSTIRSLDISSRYKVLMIDTVGFIRKLPHHLVASFKSTLEETTDADLLLHVVDISLPEFREQMNVVDSVLSELNINNQPILKVFNKIDLLEDLSMLRDLKHSEQPCVFISAQRGIFLDELENQILFFAEQHSKQMQVILPIDQTKILSQLHNIAEISAIEYKDNKTIINLTASPINARKIDRLINSIKN